MEKTSILAPLSVSKLVSKNDRDRRDSSPSGGEVHSNGSSSSSSSSLLANTRITAQSFLDTTMQVLNMKAEDTPKMMGFKELKRKSSKKAHLSAIDAEREEKRQQILMAMKEKEGDESELVLTFLKKGPEQSRGSLCVHGEIHPKMSYREEQETIRKMASTRHIYRKGSLLDTLEKGVMYPVIHIDWTPDSLASSRCSSGKEECFQDGLSIQQGLYSEVKRIEPNIAHSARDLPKTFIVLGFRSLESSISSVLESTWRDWTGARSIYLNLHTEFDLVRIVFYHRVSPVSHLELFMYLVLVEVANVTQNNVIRILDFVQRTRVERLNGYISLYRDLGHQDSDSNYHSISQTSDYSTEDGPHHSKDEASETDDKKYPYGLLHNKDKAGKTDDKRYQDGLLHTKDKAGETDDRRYHDGPFDSKDEGIAAADKIYQHAPVRPSMASGTLDAKYGATSHKLDTKYGATSHKLDTKYGATSHKRYQQHSQLRPNMFTDLGSSPGIRQVDLSQSAKGTKDGEMKSSATTKPFGVEGSERLTLNSMGNFGGNVSRQKRWDSVRAEK